MNLYFAMRENKADYPRVVVIRRKAEKHIDIGGIGYWYFDPLSKHFEVVRPERIGVKNSQCAIAFSKDEAVKLYLDGVQDVISDYENKNEPIYKDFLAARREALTLPVEEIIEC